MKTITRTFHARARESGRLLLASEDPCDQDGLILDSRGWDLSRWDGRPMKMSYNHATYGPDDFPIGRWERMESVEGDGLVGAPVFASAEYERAETAEKLRNGGFLDDVSVQFGYDPSACKEELSAGKRYLRSYRHWPLEVGFVFIGADPRAGEARGSRMLEAVTRGVITEEEAREFDPEVTLDAEPWRAENEALKNEVRTLREGLETLTASLPGRLREEIARAATPAAPVAETEAQRTTEEPEAITLDLETVRAASLAALSETVERVVYVAICRATGRLPD